MASYVRMFETEKAADDAAKKLGEAGFERYVTLHPSKVQGEEESAVWTAARDGILPGACIRACVNALTEGRSLVGVEPYFGRGQEALNILEDGGAVESDTLPSVTTHNPAPLSDTLNIPTLTTFTPMTGLKDPHWTFSSKIGMPLLSNNPTPLSSKLGMKVLTKPTHTKTSSFGMPLLMNKPAPLSSMFGMKVLSKKSKGPWTTSFGLPLLSSNPTPFSSLFGMKTIIRD